jgi:hypothetical protein
MIYTTEWQTKLRNLLLNMQFVVKLQISTNEIAECLLLVVHVAYVFVLVFGVLNFNIYCTNQVTISFFSHFRLQSKSVNTKAISVTRGVALFPVGLYHNIVEYFV